MPVLLRLIALAALAFVLGGSLAASADVVGEEEPPPPPRRRAPPAEPAPAREPAAAQPAPAPEGRADCTWLPDLRCGRHGRWDGFQKPIVHPYLFEDPFITTGLYPYYAWHEFPDRSALQGGDVQIAALQARLALSDRLALIATKDGFAWQDPDNPLLGEREGWLNIAAGLKYALVQRPEDRFLASIALRVEMPTGANDVFEGADGGVLLMPSLSAAWGVTEKLHAIAGLGGQVPTDGDTYSSNVFYELYLDYAVHPRFQPFVQLSGIHYVGSGDGSFPVQLAGGGSLPLDTAQHALGTGHFEGVDVHNLGSRGVDNHDYLTWAVGAHFPITRHVTFSAAYERPLTDRKDITQQRVTASLRLEL